MTISPKSLFVLVLATLICPGRPTPADTKLGNPADALKYRKQWAIIIGIDYESRDDVRAAGVSELQNAETDAKAVADVLTEKFGYNATENDPRQTLFLRLGPQASKEEIDSLLGNRLLKDPETVTRDDSVLVYFAGHGNRVQHDSQSEYLIFPSTVKSLPGKGIDDSSCISIASVLARLGYCQARHKLLVLDSCNSGEVFNIQPTVRSAAQYDLDRDLFQKDVLQTITAAAGNQRAPDGKEHSPFTQAMLDALQGQTIKKQVFGGSALYSTISDQVPKIAEQWQLAVSSTPRGGNLTGDGEFYFFRLGDPATDAPIDLGPRLVLLTLPGLRGKWWFEETPWLTPRVRTQPAVQAGIPVSVTTMKPLPDGSAPFPSAPSGIAAMVDVPDVYRMLREPVAQYMAGQPRQEKLILGALLDLPSKELDNDTVARLLELFDTCSDPHLKAAVHHRFNREDTKQLYLAAIDAYEKDSSPTRGLDPDKAGLARLCWSDYGRYLAVAGYLEEAGAALRNARGDAPSEEAPVLFFIDNLLLEARVQARLGEWQAADETLARAEKLADEQLPSEHPLRAAIHDRAGWNAMDRWQLDESRRRFQAAAEIRQKLPRPDLDTRIAVFHDRHGMAMVDRFKGRNTQARSDYSGLADDVAKELSRAQSNYESQLVYTRLINTLERLADSYLFASPPDPYTAHDTLDRAIDLCRHIAPQIEFKTRGRQMCKQAMALALADEPGEAAATLSRVKGSEYEKLVGKQTVDIDFFWDLASGVTKLKAEGDPGALSLRELLRQLVATSREQAFAREQLEAMLFAGQLLLEHEMTPGKPQPPTLSSDAELLMEIIPDSFVNTDNLPYLRPYFDTALQAKLATAKSLSLRSAARKIMLAKTANTLFDPPRNRSLVIFYLPDRNGYALVFPRSDMDRQPPQKFELPFGRSNLAGAALPEPMIQVVRSLDQPVDVQWSDSGLTEPLTDATFPFATAADWKLVLTAKE